MSLPLEHKRYRGNYDACYDLTQTGRNSTRLNGNLNCGITTIQSFLHYYTSYRRGIDTALKNLDSKMLFYNYVTKICQQCNYGFGLTLLHSNASDTKNARAAAAVAT
jgi:hypothetical protein